MASLWKKLLLSVNTTYSVCHFTRNLYPCIRSYSDIVVPSNSQLFTNERFYLKPEEVPPVGEFKSDVSVLEEQTVLPDVSHIGPPHDYRAFNFAAFVNYSVVLRKLVDLGVDFSKIEKLKPVPDYLLRIDFDKDVNPRIQFLLDNRVPVEELGHFFTKNPYFFMNSLSDLEVRINYLESKKFTPELITRVITGNPLWLNYSTKKVDEKLGYIQKLFKMKGFEIRLVLQKSPKTLNVTKDRFQRNLFEMSEVQEFSISECKKIFINYPSVWNQWTDQIKERLEYLILDMEVPKWLIVADPVALTHCKNRLQSRHLFLKSLGRAQYDPKKPNYITMQKFCKGPDTIFCQDVAKTSIETYNLFLKTL